MDVQLGERSPDAVEVTARLVEPVARRFFRYEMHGLESVPKGPCLLVGNHSGAGAVEIPCMLVAWYRHFGEARPGYGLTNVVTMKNPLFAPWLSAIGAIPASHDQARAAIGARKDVLVFPGGDIDSFRPFYETRKVVFGKRRGYIRLALEMGIPIVPLATIGSHLTYWMAPGNAWIAKRLRLKRPSVRLESVPLTVGMLAAAAAVGAAAVSIIDPVIALAFLGAAIVPFPSRITTQVLPAIDLQRDLPGDLGTEERVERGHQLVFHALQDAVKRMKHGEPFATRATKST